MNLVILHGRLGADPDLRFTQSGQAVMNMRLATSETWMDKEGQKKERTDWHSLTLWGKRAEGLARHLSKGSECIVRGRLQTSSYEDKEGVKRYKTEVVIDEFEFAGSKKDNAGGGDRDDDRGDRGRSSQQRPSGGGGGSNRPAQEQRPPADFNPDTGGADDDIPF